MSSGDQRPYVFVPLFTKRFKNLCSFLAQIEFRRMIALEVYQSLMQKFTVHLLQKTAQSNVDKEAHTE